MVSVSISRNIQQGVDPASTYILEEQIGDGSFGEVFKGKLKKTGETVAVKIVAIQDDEELMEFQVEIDILFKCNDPNIIKIHAAYLWKRTLYMVLEYCGGGSLDDIYEQLESPLDEPQIKEVCYYTLQALVFMHANHMVHRDIKAGNVLLTNAGEVKIADFGVSALNSGPNMRRDTFIGTPYWMAPEVIACETSKENPYDELCDIWSVGITAIEFAQMNPPYHDLHPMRVLFRIPKSVPPKLSDPDAWSPEFNDFIHQCLIKDPAQRASAKKMLQHPFFTANGYKPTHSEMLRLLAERSSIEESMESVSIGEDASGDDVSMDEMTDNVSRMSVVEHSDAADGPKPFLAPKPQTEERKVNVVKTRTIRNTDGTFKRVTTKKKLTEVENTRQVRKAKENQIQAVRKQARLERVESKTREASNIRTLEIAMREQASQLAIVRRRHQDNVDSIQRTMNRELDKHKSSMPDLLKQKERMLRKKRDKDLAEQTSLIDTQTKYGLKELKAQLKKNDYSKADVKTKLEVYEKTHSQEKNDRLKEWRRAQRAQHNKELLESELQLLETQYQLEYNGTKQLHAANMSWLNVGEKKICWDNLNKIHALERQMLVQQKEAELTRGVQNHSHRLEMQSEINKQRNANLQAIIRVMRKKQLPRDQDTQFRSALHDFKESEQMLIESLKTSNRAKRDNCGLPKAERKRLKAQHTEEEQLLIKENKVRFMASEERKRKRLAAEMDEKIRHMNQQSAEQAEAEMSEINEYNELRKEKMHLKNQSADEASKRKYDKQVEEFHQNFETHLEQLTARQKLEMESLAHKYVQLRDQVIEKWSNAAAGGSSVSLNNSSQSGLNLVSSIRSSSSMSSHRSFRT